MAAVTRHCKPGFPVQLCLSSVLWQAGAVKGKQGLGRSSMPKKVAGVRFAGKKTRIAESDEEGDEDAPVNAESDKPSSGAGQEVSADVSAGDSKGGKRKPAVKWKKIAMRVLREAGGSMKVEHVAKDRHCIWARVDPLHYLIGCGDLTRG